MRFHTLMSSEPNTFLIPAILEGYTPLKDGGVSVRFHTQEADTLDKLKIIEYYQKFGWLQFSEVESMSIPQEPIDRASGEKSRAQVLRGVLYRLWEISDTKDIETSDAYYRRIMDEVINKYKERLPK